MVWPQRTFASWIAISASRHLGLQAGRCNSQKGSCLKNECPLIRVLAKNVKQATLASAFAHIVNSCIDLGSLGEQEAW